MGDSPRVALVDCYANRNLFVGDEAFRGLAAQLRDDGADVRLLDLVRDEPPPGKSVEEVLHVIRAAAPGFLIVSRAWNEALVESLRQAAGDTARLVRYSYGAPSTIDPLFDAVLDPQAVRRLVLGDDNVRAPTWRLTRQQIAALEPEFVSSTAARPSITGPAVGCPFLVDVRSSPAYRDSGIDYDRVQSKGCAFCLDNVGAYASFPAEVVVDTWLKQLRALRRQRPDVREILLTDERPHPYLPSLFRAVLGEPSLHGIELLIKTRVDWLAEFADGALHEACDLAAQSGSVLHAYLVGFESFHQPDLDLFNKAIIVADNVRAIAILRDLATRHPRSFEFERLHMHGIILFHPWTTPEGLLENARVMREVRFHELRLYALRTRMRLYGSVPLHALAVRDGLLTDHFDDGRGDRAVEQGYDASVPWRFKDPRIEAIFRAANHLSEVLPELHDADALEMVTRFVLRWPAFADAPELAGFPLRQAPFSWGASAANVVAVAGAAIAGYDREIEAVAAGRKAACLKEGVPIADADQLVRAYQLMGLAVEIVSTHARGGDDGRHEPGDTHAIVAVAANADTLNGVLEHQRAVERGDAPHIAAMGALMGYPPCCVAAFAAQRARGDNLDLERAPLRAHPERPLAPLINRFGAVTLISHMLCTPDCAASIARATASLDAIAAVDPPAAQRIRDHVNAKILRLDYARAALVAGTWNGDRFVVDSLEPFMLTDLGIEPHSVHALRVEPDRVIFERADGSTQTIAAAAPILIEPGLVIAPAMARVLARGPAPRPAATAQASASVLTDIRHLLAPQTQVGEHQIMETESDGADGYQVTLGHDVEVIRVWIHPWNPARPALSRRGGWALDLEANGTPSETDRKVIGALALLLPAGSHHEGPSGNAEASRSMPR